MALSRPSTNASNRNTDTRITAISHTTKAAFSRANVPIGCCGKRTINPTPLRTAFLGLTLMSKRRHSAALMSSHWLANDHRCVAAFRFLTCLIGIDLQNERLKLCDDLPQLRNDLCRCHFLCRLLRCRPAVYSIQVVNLGSFGNRGNFGSLGKAGTLVSRLFSTNSLNVLISQPPLASV